MDYKKFIELLKEEFPDMEIISIDLNTKKSKDKVKLTAFERNLSNMIDVIEEIDILKVTENDSHLTINTIGCMIACINSYDINKIHNKELLVKYSDFLRKYRNIFDTVFYRKIKDIRSRIPITRNNTNK